MSAKPTFYIIFTGLLHHIHGPFRPYGLTDPG